MHDKNKIQKYTHAQLRDCLEKFVKRTGWAFPDPGSNTYDLITSEESIIGSGAILRMIPNQRMCDHRTPSNHKTLEEINAEHTLKAYFDISHLGGYAIRTSFHTSYDYGLYTTLVVITNPTPDTYNKYTVYLGLVPCHAIVLALNDDGRKNMYDAVQETFKQEFGELLDSSSSSTLVKKDLQQST